MNQVLRAFKAWQYRGGRPHRWARIENRLWAIVSAAGLWNRAATLEVRGRKSGRLISLPVAITEHQDERYLVAMLGERTNWVTNVRAAGGRAVLRRAAGVRSTLRRCPSSSAHRSCGSTWTSRPRHGRTSP